MFLEAECFDVYLNLELLYLLTLHLTKALFHQLDTKFLKIVILVTALHIIAPIELKRNFERDSL